MPRSIWKGAISFGLVNIPVALYSAESRQELRFNQLDKKTGHRVRMHRVDEETGEEVNWEDIVRGYDTGEGRYVVLSDDDVASANPKATQTVDILGFVRAEEIDVAHYDKPYFLGPTASGKKGYALLRDVLHRTDRVAIATVVIRTKQYLAAIFARGPVMVLEVLRYAYELRDPVEIDVPSDDLEALGLKKPEIAMAEQLVDAMTETWQPEQYRDTFRDDVLSMIDEKAKAGEPGATAPVGAARASDEGKVVDIMALLKRSIAEARSEEAADEAASVADAEEAATGTHGRTVAAARKGPTAKKPAGTKTAAGGTPRRAAAGGSTKRSAGAAPRRRGASA
jgi:DNA end-binding protein Ku